MQEGKEASYLLIHIVESAGAHYLGGEIRDFETRSDEENIQRYVEDIRQLGYEADYRIGYGRTAKAIARVIQEDNCDFLVMGAHGRSEEHTSELQSLMRISYAVFCMKKKQASHTVLHITIL